MTKIAHTNAMIMGKRIVAAATFEMNAVRNWAATQHNSIVSSGGQDAIPTISCATLTNNPLSRLPSANAKPAPSSKIRPHGTF